MVYCRVLICTTRAEFEIETGLEIALLILRVNAPNQSYLSGVSRMGGNPGVEGKGVLMRPSCEKKKGRIKHSGGSMGRVRGIRNLPIRPVFFFLH